MAAPLTMSSERRKQYPFDEFEPRWQKLWEETKAFRTLGPGDAGFDPSKPKYYVLDMFPYPSGSGLHVGHPEGYTATDIIGRYKKLSGYNVLHPMGWDAFGLPAEQYAIKTGQHPRKTTEQNIATFRGQLKRLGFAYDWDREVNTTDPGYFKWTQWIFLQLYHSYFDEKTNKARPISELEAEGLTRHEVDARRLAFVSEAPVNWCPGLGTVLANEEVIDGKSEVGGFPVERRPMRQWMLRITAFAQRLIDELDGLDWPESIKLLQRNWIGRSEGAEVGFQTWPHGAPYPPTADHDFKSPWIRVFTTRPDTLFGATYLVLAPEHPLVDAVTTEEQRAAVAEYREKSSRKSDLERTELAKEKTGVFTGGFAVNPVNGELIPIWIADYVLTGYGTGAIMAVPAHDERDWEFATKFSLPIIQVVQAEAQGSAGVSPVQSQNPAQKSSAPIQTLQEFTEITKYRRRLPHWQQGNCTVFVTWRLADSLPAEKLRQWETERAAWISAHPKPWSEEVEEEYHQRFSDKLDEWLDAGAGSCVLRQPQISSIVANALRHFDGERYSIYSAVVMPNHVHVLFQPLADHKIEDIVQSWKSFTSKAIGKLLGTDGKFWQPEYFDRLVRGLPHFERFVRYIGENPVLAKLGDGEFVLLEKEENEGTGETPALPYTDNGFAINSDFLNGMSTVEAKKSIIAWLGNIGYGKGTVNFKLRDWLFSRQRYWGEPFPIIWEDGQHRAVPESDLPVVPPDLADFKPSGTPEPPLSKAKDWVQYSAKATRETNTMPQWGGSCWYYLRYCDPDNATRFVSKEAEAYWMGGRRGQDTETRRPGDTEKEAVSSSPHLPVSASSPKGGVDLYVGGTEHAVLHLLYARFWHKALFDLGYVTTPEPFQRLVNQGLILGEMELTLFKSADGALCSTAEFRDIAEEAIEAAEVDENSSIRTRLAGIHKKTGEKVIGVKVSADEVEKIGEGFALKTDHSILVDARSAKMSKSRGNVVNPDHVVAEYGADSLRLYEMFMGPLEQVKPWSMKGVEGVYRFLARVWRLVLESNQEGEWSFSSQLQDVAPDKKLNKIIHETIKKVGEDIERLSFNTAISQMMVLTNAFTQSEVRPVSGVLTLLQALNPFAPHISEELAVRIGTAFPKLKISGLLAHQTWPAFDPAALVEDEAEVVLQVNGKKRGTLTIPKGLGKAELESLSLANPKVQEFTAGLTIRKVVVVPDKLVNVVAN